MFNSDNFSVHSDRVGLGSPNSCDHTDWEGKKKRKKISAKYCTTLPLIGMELVKLPLKHSA